MSDMPILQRLRIPRTPEELPLYAKPGVDADISDQSWILRRGAELSLDSFFNACFIGDNGWPSQIASGVSCNLHLKGDFLIRLCVRETHGMERTILKTEVRGCEAERPINLPFEQLGMDFEPCRVFPRVMALSNDAVFQGGNYCCLIKGKPVTLGVVICTYKREQVAIRNARILAADRDLINARIQIVLVDNASTINPEELPEGVVLLKNKNLGGAGGFSRGLVELLEGQACSHVVLMDDDIQLDTEAVFRCLNHFRYHPEGLAIAGILLDEDKPSLIQEAGAWMNDSGSPLVVRPGFTGADLAEPFTLDALHSAPQPEYGGFWFFAFPLSLVQQRLLLPFFIKGDDVEFGLRLQKEGIGCRLLLGVGVRHPGFLNSFDMTKRYFWVRNMLIVEMLHGHRSALDLIKPLLSEAFREWRRGRQAHEKALVRGMNDFLNGPDWLERSDNSHLAFSLKEEQVHLRDMSEKKEIALLFLQAIFCCLKMAFSAKRLRAAWRRKAPTLASRERWKAQFSK